MSEEKEGLVEFMNFNSNLFWRILSALVLLPLVIFLVYKASNSWLRIILALLSILALREWFNLYELPFKWLILSSLYFLFSFFYFPISYFPLFFLLTVIFSFLFFLSSFSSYLFRSFFFPMIFFLSYTYLAVQGLWAIATELGRDYLFFLLMLVFANDTGAYFTGRSWGRSPLVPEISPKKTWEGFWGGILLAMLVGYLINLKLALFSFKAFLLLTFFVVLGANLGDLLESAVKRSVGKKDAGTLIPGHGGLLDRIDSLLLGALCFYYLIKFLG